MVIAERLLAVRKQNKLTQQEFAEKIGLAKSTISTYELGSAVPSCEVLYKICTLFKVSADYMLGLDERKFLCIDGINQKAQTAIAELIISMRKKNQTGSKATTQR